MAGEADIGKLVTEVTIQYSVRELLTRIEERLVRADERISGLASKTEVEKLSEQVTRHEARWNKVIGAAMGVGAVTGGLAGYLANLLAQPPH